MHTVLSHHELQRTSLTDQSCVTWHKTELTTPIYNCHIMCDSSLTLTFIRLITMTKTLVTRVSE